MGEGCQGSVEVFADLGACTSITVPQDRSSDIRRLGAQYGTDLLLAILYLEQYKYPINRMQFVTYL
jgi:hypothetical protein